MSKNHPAKENPARWRKLRAEIFDACELALRRSCGKSGRLELDHIKPVEQDGARWDRANLQPLASSPKVPFSKTAKEREARRGPPTAWQRLVAARLQVPAK